MSDSNAIGPRLAGQRRPLLTIFARESLPPEAIAFQDPIDEICARPAPTFLRGTLYLVALLFVSLLAVATFAKVDVVVIASGRLITATPPIVLQPMERSIVRELRVHPGDAVTKGQILAKLDPTFADADTESLRRQLHMLQAQARRLEAEEASRPFSVDAIAADGEDALQKALYDQRQAEYAARLRVFDEDIERLRAGLRTLEDGRGAFGRELGVAREVEGMRSALLRAQTGSRLHLLEAQGARLRVESDREQADDRVRELRHGEESRSAERQGFIDNWRRQLIEALVATRTDMARVSASLAKAARLNDLVVVTAPTDGTVLDVAARPEGAVLREAETLLTIVPRDAPLIAEVMIASADVGDTAAGAPARLKIDAFPYQRHGMMEGRLESVGEESFSPGTGADAAPVGRGGAFHRARIDVLDTRLNRLPAGARLFPGMTLTAEIKAGTRSVLSYFLYPLSRGLAESMREP